VDFATGIFDIADFRFCCTSPDAFFRRKVDQINTQGALRFLGSRGPRGSFLNVGAASAQRQIIKGLA
jgi:hypothetical protein